MTKTWHFTDSPDAGQRREIAATLRDGGVVLLPTDTIYGLHAPALNAEAVGRIAAIKGRDDDKPFVVLAGSADDLHRIGVNASDDLASRLRSVWPAPLTVILPLHAPVPASRGATTIAVRVPALDWLRDLATESGPLVSTSANRSGEPPIKHPSEFARELQSQLDGIADCGLLEREPSAILDLTSDPPRFLREGDRSFTQLVWKRLRISR